MKTILITAYAVNPYKGSEDGTGWNMIYQVAKSHKVIAVTRRNNREAIEKYITENKSDETLGNLMFKYYDLPKWARFWKKGKIGYLFYFYLWQFFMPLFLLQQKLSFDIAHSLNFHSDTHPHFLWLLGKPTVWGPIGHHPYIPPRYLVPAYGWKAWIKQTGMHLLKKGMRILNPFFWLSVALSKHIFVINTASRKVIPKSSAKVTIMPAVATDFVQQATPTHTTKFSLLTVGRFVPMKGFDIALKAYAKFLERLEESQKNKTELLLIGKGPAKNKLMEIAAGLQISQQVKFIDWIARDELKKCYQNANLFLFPSHEGAGMVVPEALSYSMPVLCFDNVGPGELAGIGGDKIPHLSYQGSINAFADTIEKHFKSPDYHNKKRNAARRQFLSTYQWELKGNKFKTIYQSIINGSKAYHSRSALAQ